MNETLRDMFKIIRVVKRTGISLLVQWLEFQTSTAGGMGSVPGWGSKILLSLWCRQKNKKKNREQTEM